MGICKICGNKTGSMNRYCSDDCKRKAHIEDVKKWQTKNKEKVDKYLELRKSSDHYKEYQKEYAKKNREKLNEYKKKWLKNRKQLNITENNTTLNTE